MIVTYVGAAAAEFSSSAVPAFLQTLGVMGRYVSVVILTLPLKLEYAIICAKLVTHKINRSPA